MSDKKKILLLSTQTREMLEQLEVRDDTAWFRDALSGIRESIRFESFHIPTQGLPEEKDFDGIIIGGSSLSTYDRNRPWIRRAEEFIVDMAEKEAAILGVCFGHQLVVQAFGGKIKENEKGLEFGVEEIDLTSAGQEDPLFRGVPSTFRAPEAHQDIIEELPPIKDVKVLAQNKSSAYQALSLGERIRTVQFHPEFTPDILENFARIRKEKFKERGFVKNDREWKELIDSFRDTPEARKVLTNFVEKFIIDRPFSEIKAGAL